MTVAYQTLYITPLLLGLILLPKLPGRPSPACENIPIILTDSSSVIYGTVNQWNWNINNTTYTTKNPVLTNGLPAGNNLVSLSVRTAEGCISPVETTLLPVLPAPIVDFSYADICAGEMVDAARCKSLTSIINRSMGMDTLVTGEPTAAESI